MGLPQHIPGAFADGDMVMESQYQRYIGVPDEHLAVADGSGGKAMSVPVGRYRISGDVENVGGTVGKIVGTSTGPMDDEGDIDNTMPVADGAEDELIVSPVPITSHKSDDHCSADKAFLSTLSM